MTDLLLIIIATALVNNFVLANFLGLCPFLGASSRLETAVGMALATSFVLTLASGLSYLVNTYILLPTQTEYLRLLVFIVIIAGHGAVYRTSYSAQQPNAASNSRHVFAANYD